MFSNTAMNSVTNYAATTPTTVDKRKAKYKHPCPWPGCERRFTCPHNVQQHVKEKHTKERDQRCNQCPAAFTRPFALNRHMDKVHGVKIGPGRGKTKRKKIDIANAAPTPNVQAEDEGGDMALLRDASMNDLFAPSPVENFDVDFDFNAPINFPDSAPSKNSTDSLVYSPTSCHFCRAVFKNRGEVLIHLHNAHNQPKSPFCNCTICSGGATEAAPLTGDQRLGEGGPDFGSIPTWLQHGGTSASASQAQPSVWTQGMQDMGNPAYKRDGQDDGFGNVFGTDLFTSGMTTINGMISNQFGVRPAQEEPVPGTMAPAANEISTDFGDGMLDWLGDANLVYGGFGETRTAEAEDILRKL